MTIEVEKREADKDFVDALIDRVKDQLRIKLDYKKSQIDSWNTYVNENISMFSQKIKYINVMDVIELGIDKITYRETPAKFIIGIKENFYIKNVYLDVENFCRLINFGNLSMSGIWIFTDVFDKTSEDISKLADMYYSGEMI